MILLPKLHAADDAAQEVPAQLTCMRAVGEALDRELEPAAVGSCTGLLSSLEMADLVRR